MGDEVSKRFNTAKDFDFDRFVTVWIGAAVVANAKINFLQHDKGPMSSVLVNKWLIVLLIHILLELVLDCVHEDKTQFIVRWNVDGELRKSWDRTSHSNKDSCNVEFNDYN